MATAPTAADELLAQRKLQQANALRWHSIGQFLNGCTWTVCATASTGMSMQLAPSQAHLLRMMSMVASVSGVAQFFLLPVCGAVSDVVGRRVVLMARAVSSAVFTSMMALKPSYSVFLLYRLMGSLTWFLTDTALQASLADVFEGAELAAATAKTRSTMGVAMLLGPLVGGWLAQRSFRACFALSACAAVVSFFAYALGLRETLQHTGEEKRRRLGQVELAAANPLAFVKLFTKGRSLILLTLVSCLSEMCDGTYEVDRHYGLDVVQMSLTQDGIHNSLRGVRVLQYRSGQSIHACCVCRPETTCYIACMEQAVHARPYSSAFQKPTTFGVLLLLLPPLLLQGAMVVGGYLVGPLLKWTHALRYTCLCNSAALLHFILKFVARSPAVYMSSMIP